MPVPEDLIPVIRESRCPVWLKLDNYVPAVLSPNAHSSKAGPYWEGSLGELWDEDRLRGYLQAEAALNDTSSNMDFREGRRSVSLFIGDFHHSWVRHYHISRQGTDYVWVRVK